MAEEVDKTDIEDAVFSLEEKDVKFIRLQFTDILGIPKDVEITLDELPKALEEGIAFDGSSIEGFARICESDMYLHPDLETLKIYPWYSTTSEGEEYGNARLICDVHMPNGEPFEGDPRYRLRKVQREAGEEGLRMFVGAEPEFFMFRRNGEEELRNNSTALHDQGGYFDLMPVDKGEEARKDIVISLEKMGFEVEAAHHEVASSQHEIDFRYGEATTLADHLITFKTTTKTIALKHGLNATFMPKPYAKINGSGMHTHISLEEDGENCFYQPDNPYELSDKALYFIGGLIEHIGALTALSNPTINSYKRLVPGYEAPVNISWGRHNRSVLIRVPHTSTPEVSTRIEFRSPDPTANPYLAFAGILKAGLHGIEDEIEPPEPVEEDLYEMKAGTKADRGISSLPGSLSEALEELEKDDVIAEAIGSHIMENYLRAKRTETREYQVNVTDWELEKYMKYY
ncbi:MAG: type I glutamate--ammonia ligase [Candidatus Bipolaricaulota bacterium]|nr:type I glutamate--ammonia ligase [Candidatus Bipolaricaulota bacterium]MBS3792739.1 type I glutamate--ammonia ligase [Candidatus Bipolaricaulota bacterium]